MNVIYVDDERPAIDNFRLTTKHFPEVRTLHTFQTGEEALAFAQKNPVDAAFLDIEMPGLHGLDLARALKRHDPRIHVVFVTAYSQYALEAWGVDAVGYLLKPYTAGELRKELAKCSYRVLPPQQRVVIETIPTLSVTVNGAPLFLPGAKLREMLALLVDRGSSGLTVGEGIAYLWPERGADSATQSLCRMTWKRLVDALKSAGAGDVLYTADNRRYLNVEQVECDLYHILDGDPQYMRKYNGEYLREYEWAEERNAQLHWMMSQSVG